MSDDDRSTKISALFRSAFEAHPSRESDPALALESARGTAAAAIPDGITGAFDDEALTFTADTTYRVKHSHGHVDGPYSSYDDAVAAVRSVYRTAEIGHDGDIADGGESTLVWADAESSIDDDGARAVASIRRSHW